MSFEKAIKGIDQHVWSSEPEVGEMIKRLIIHNNCKHVVESGTFKGFTSCFIIDALSGDGHFISIDIEDHRTDSVKAYFEQSKSTFVKNDSLEFLPSIKQNSIDLIFLDSSHEYDHVKAEFKICEGLIKQNGLMILHDYYSHEGVRKWVDELKQHSWFEILTLQTSRNNGITIIKCLYAK